MSIPLSNQETKQIEIRGCLSKHKKSQYYQAILIYVNECGQEVRKSRSTKQSRKSEAFKVMMKMIVKEEELLRKPAPGTYFVDFLEYWINEVIVKEIEETTWNGYKRNVFDHIIPYFKPLELRMRDLRPAHIIRFVEDKIDHGGLKNGGPLKAHSVRKFHANLKTALDYAVANELIATNPARVIKAPKVEPYEASYYSIEELAELWEASRGTDIESAIILATLYGFRRGEVCGLKWDMINFRARSIRIFETRTQSKKEIIKGPKNKSSKRTMPMMDFAYDYLMRLKAKQDQQREFMGNSWIDSGYVVAYPDGKQPSVSNLNKMMNRLLEKHGLRHIRFHDLRHSIATYLLEIGVPIADVSAWLGHGSVETTAKVYAHVTLGMRLNTAKALDKAFGYTTQITEEKPLTIESVIRDLFELSAAA